MKQAMLLMSGSIGDFLLKSAYSLLAADLRVYDACEHMRVIFQKIREDYQPRFVLNYNDYTAWELGGLNQQLLPIDDNGIEWDTLSELPENIIQEVKEHKAMHSVDIEDFCDGVSRVSWQLTPDESTEHEKYGNNDAKATVIYGYINAHGQFVRKFKLPSDPNHD